MFSSGKTRHGTVPHRTRLRFVVPVLRVLVEVGATDTAQPPALVAAEYLWRQGLADQVAHPALQVDDGRRDVALVLLVTALGVAVPDVVHPADLERQVGVLEAALARPTDVGGELCRKSDAVAHAGDGKQQVDLAAGDLVVEAAEDEGLDLHR